MLFNLIKNKGLIENLVVGLGNPTSKYDKTRHNVGFMCIDYIAQKLGVDIKKNKFDALYGEAILGDKKVLLIKPQTYMNLSGEAVSKFASFYKISSENLIILSDDISLDIGKMRIKRKGTHGGHNGLRNIIDLLGNNNFPRIKIGVGNKPSDWNLSDWVLSKFSCTEVEKLNDLMENVYDATKLIICDNIDKAMNKFN